ncbi:MAG: GNAT family N-acetyltransferase [Nocardioidaceae bacterium]
MAVIRPATLADAEAWAEIVTSSAAYHVFGADTFEWSFHHGSPAALRVVLTQDDTVMGVADFFPEQGSGVVHVGVTIHPNHRGRGLGTILWDWHQERISSLSLDFLQAQVIVNDDVASRAAAARWGFWELKRAEYSMVDPRSVVHHDASPSTVQVVPLLDLDPGDVWRALVSADDGRDITGLSGIPSFEGFLFDHWEHPDGRLDLAHAVLVRDRIATVTFLDVVGDRAISRATSTVPALRNRGFAALSKERTLMAAAQAGVTRAYAGSHVENVSMRAVNARLGYTPVASPTVQRRSVDRRARWRRILLPRG